MTYEGETFEFIAQEFMEICYKKHELLWFGVGFGGGFGVSKKLAVSCFRSCLPQLLAAVAHHTGFMC